MKALLRLALVVVILAVATVSTSADGFSLTPKPIGSFELQCTQFCMVVLCAEPNVCGVFINSNGQRDCGCHNPYGGVVGS